MVQFLQILDTNMTRPTPYGWFHLGSLVLTALIIVWVCIVAKKHDSKKVVDAVFWTAVAVAVLEVYKQINYTFRVEDGVIVTDYQWYAFPFQFCSTPMYVGLLAGIIRKGKVHDALCAYLATFSVFAGLAVMLYPNDIYIDTIGINIQTTVCHCSMLIIGAYLFASGHVKVELKTALKAMPVFAVMVGIAAVANEVAVAAGLEETFNMFYISPHCEGTLPVYSLVQKVVPFPWCLVLYIVGFTAAACVIVLIAMGIDRLTHRKKVTA